MNKDEISGKIDQVVGKVSKASAKPLAIRKWPIKELSIKQSEEAMDLTDIHRAFRRA
jgi:hypothetical protein